MVAGKGGAGRTTVAAALALRAAARGQRVLAVDALGNGGLDQALRRAADPGGLDPDAAGPPARPGVMTGPDRNGVTRLTLSTEAALDQYVRMNLKLSVGIRTLGPVARILDFVATAAPAVREILSIGKIGWEVRTGPWDLVVVDGPATGHVVELLGAPDALAPLVGRSPLADDTAWLSALLADPAVTRTLIVSLPEELVVTESMELATRLGAETRIHLAAVVANRMPAPVGPAGVAEAGRLIDQGDPLGPLATLAVARHQASAAQRVRLAELDRPVLEVPEQSGGAVAAALAALDAAGW